MERVYTRPTQFSRSSNGASSSQARRPRPAPPPKKEEVFPVNEPQRVGSAVEYAVRVPKQANGRSYHAMKFNANLNVDIRQWSKVNVARENNRREFKAALQEEEMPKFGAGSEYGRDAREEARRRKYGRMSKKYSPENQPWLMKVGGKGGKKFRGVREGGVTENASYYVLMQSTTTAGVFEAYPVQHWYNFTPIQRFKALTAEEAEEEFGRRNKIMNYFSVMVKKKLKTEGEEEGGAGEDEEGKKKGGKKTKAESKSALKISEMDEWIDSDEESDDDSDEEGKDKKKKKKGDDSDDDDKKKKGKKQPKKNKKVKELESEAEEESDDGDEEGREMDYDSESSASEGELETKREEKGVEEEDNLRRILGSDSEDEDEEEKKDEDEKEGEDKKDGKDEKKEDGKASQSGDAGKAKDKKGKAKKGKKEAEKGVTSRDNSGDSSDISESELEREASSLFDKRGKASKSASENNSRSSSPPAPPQDAMGRGEKRKADEAGSSVGQQVAKKLKSDGPEKLSSANTNLPAAVLQAAVDAGITEEAVTRYLMRKPMTAKELLLKFKGKKTGISSDHMVILIAQILQRLNLEKRKVRDSMYFSLKP